MNRNQKYAIRKLSIGAVSLVIGLSAIAPSSFAALETKAEQISEDGFVTGAKNYAVKAILKIENNIAYVEVEAFENMSNVDIEVITEDGKIYGKKIANLNKGEVTTLALDEKEKTLPKTAVVREVLRFSGKKLDKNYYVRVSYDIEKENQDLDKKTDNTTADNDNQKDTTENKKPIIDNPLDQDNNDKKIAIVEEVVTPFDTEITEDNTLDFGVEIVDEEGQDEIKSVTKIDGKIIAENILQVGKTKKIRKGTKKETAVLDDNLTTDEKPEVVLEKIEPNAIYVANENSQDTAGTQLVTSEGSPGYIAKEIKKNADGLVSETIVDSKKASDKVVEVSTKKVVESKVLENKTTYRANPSSDKVAGTKTVLVKGSAGYVRKTTTYELDTATGQVNPNTHQEEVLAVDEIVEVSTKAKTEKTMISADTRYEAVENSNLQAGSEISRTMGEDGYEEKITNYTLDETTGNINPVETINQKAKQDTIVKISTKPTIREEIINPKTVYRGDDNKDLNSADETITGTVGRNVYKTTYSLNTDGSVLANPEELVETVTASDTVIVKGTKASYREIAIQTRRVENKTMLATDSEREVYAGKKGLEKTSYTIDANTGHITASTETITPMEERIVEYGSGSLREITLDPIYQADNNLDYNTSVSIAGRPKVIKPDGSVVDNGQAEIIKVGTKPQEESKWTLDANQRAVEEIIRTTYDLDTTNGNVTPVITKRQGQIKEKIVTETPISPKVIYQAADTENVGYRQEITGTAGKTIKTIYWTIENNLPKENIKTTTENAIDTVIKIGTKEEKRENEVLFATTYTEVEDPNLPEGHIISETQGVNGYDSVVYRWSVNEQTGNLENKIQVSRVTTNPINKEITKSKKPIIEIVKKIEFKNITDLKIYTNSVNGTETRVLSLGTNDNPNNYYAKIQVNGLTDVYAPISKIIGANQIEISFENLVRADGNSYTDNFIYDISNHSQHNNTVDFASLKDAKTGYEIAYHNINKLIPLYNKEQVIKYGNLLDTNHHLFKKEIAYVVPMINSEIANAVSDQHKNSINKLMIKYKDDTISYLTASYAGDFSNLAEYNLNVDGKEILYTPVQSLGNKAVAQKVKANFETLDLYSGSMYEQIKPADNNIRAIEIVQQKIKMLRERGFTGAAIGNNLNTISDAEAKAALLKPYIQKLNYDKALENIKNELLDNLTTSIENSGVFLGTNSVIDKVFEDKLNLNKEKIMLSLMYLERLYTVDYNDINIGDLVKFYTKFYGKEYLDGNTRSKTNNAIDWLIQLGNFTYSNINIAQNVNLYNNKFTSSITSGLTTIDKFLEYNHKLFAADKSINDWFKQSSKALILEEKSKSNPSHNVETYYRLLNGHSTEKAHLLALLNLSDANLFVLSTMGNLTYGTVGTYLDESLKHTDKSTYEQKLQELKVELEKNVKAQAAYQDFLYRLAIQDTTKKQVINATTTIDSMRRFSVDNTNDQRFWSDETGVNALDGVSEFLTPLNLWRLRLNAGAEASGNRIYFFTNKLLTNTGLATYVHEVTHILDNSVLLNNYLTRTSFEENYARGLFEPSDVAVISNSELGIAERGMNSNGMLFGFNPIFDWSDVNTGRMYNKTPERFADANDLKTYMKNAFDVIYSLDILEAQQMFNRTNEDKISWYKKVVATAGNTASESNEEYKAIDNTIATNLTSIDKLIEEDIVARRFAYKSFAKLGTTKQNDYYDTNMFAPTYAAITSDKGISGAVTTRINAFELLAEFGYYEGMVPYISSQYKNQAQLENKVFSDHYILEKVFANSNKSYTNYEDFKKEMYNRRLQNLDNMKVINFTYNGQNYTSDKATITRLMNEAITNDLAEIKRYTDSFRNVSNLNKLKAAIYSAYLVETDDFRTSIYQ